MQIIETGDIFSSHAQTIVNTVNCVGVMGKGLALEYRKRYPDMFIAYERICMQKKLDIGKLWLYKTNQKWILNFPTKYDWRKPSDLVFFEKGLIKFLATYEKKGITSIAFPLLGASNGGIPPEKSLQIMTKYLSQCEIPVFVYLKFSNRQPQLFANNTKDT